jgi:protein TonB
MASILAIPYLSELLKKEKVSSYKPPVESVIDMTIIEDKDKPLPPEMTQRQEIPSGPSQAWTAPLIVDFTTDTMPTARDLVNPGAITSDGDPGGWGVPCPNCVDQVSDVIGEDPHKIYPYAALEQKPEFIGGEDALRKYLGDNLVYPPHAKEIGYEGKVYISFVIDQFGNVVNAKIAREVGGGLDEEALRVVTAMPRWKPGKQAGHPVSVSYTLPIVFALN